MCPAQKHTRVWPFSVILWGTWSTLRVGESSHFFISVLLFGGEITQHSERERERLKSVINNHLETRDFTYWVTIQIFKRKFAVSPLKMMRFTEIKWTKCHGLSCGSVPLVFQFFSLSFRAGWRACRGRSKQTPRLQICWLPGCGHWNSPASAASCQVEATPGVSSVTQSWCPDTVVIPPKSVPPRGIRF